MEKVIVASDHAGFELKNCIKHNILNCGFDPIDAGCNSLDQTDYPIHAKEAIRLMIEHKAKFCILICGSGIGVSITANRYQGIRAALCHDTEYARLARQHNDANVLCLGGRYLDSYSAGEIVNTFLLTPYSNQERHTRRNQMLDS